MIKSLRKEFLYAIRSSRFLIIMVTFLFFGILSPLMFKVFLPLVLHSQFPGLTDAMMAEMIDMSQTGSLKSFFNDLFEIGSLIVAFSLCGLVAQEIKDHTLIIPVCSGKRFSQMIVAKMIVFSMLLFTAVIISVTVSYLYGGLLFAFEIEYPLVLIASFLQSLYLIFLLASLLFLGSLIKKPIPAGLMALLLAYGLQAFGSLLKINYWLPSGLITTIQELNTVESIDVTHSLLITTALIASMTALTIYRLRTIELNER